MSDLFSRFILVVILFVMRDLNFLRHWRFELLWVVMACSVVDAWNFGILPEHYTTSRLEELAVKLFVMYHN